MRDMAVGDQIDENCVRSIRPGFGLAPKHFKTLLGKRLSMSVRRGDPVTHDVFIK